MNKTSAVQVKGKTIDDFTRCQHYHSTFDVIAIKFRCCNEYYPCFNCHEESADHEAKKWSKIEFHKKAVLCGVCKTEMDIHQYLNCQNQCPVCGAAFNPGCSNHYHLYFEV